MTRQLLMLNWRDCWHPAAGGAELVTYRILQGLVRDHGWTVEWFSAAYPGAPSEELRDGIRFVRLGRQTTVHLRAFQRYRLDSRFDVVVDQTNTIPFFTTLYARAPVVLYINQLAREVWLHEAPPLLNLVGYATEPLFLAPYRRRPVITISESSRDSLRELGFRGTIVIIPMAVDDPGDESCSAKGSVFDIVTLGRVTPSKRIEDSLFAAALLRERGWRGTLHVAGGAKSGYLAHLRRLSESLGASVCFCGRISNEERHGLLRSASLLWMTSAREGWGLVVTEAARHWTPAVAYASPGLRDSIRDGVTGKLTASRPADLADATWDLMRDRLRWRQYAEAARTWSLELTWERTTAGFAAAIEAVLA